MRSVCHRGAMTRGLARWITAGLVMLLAVHAHGFVLSPSACLVSAGFPQHRPAKSVRCSLVYRACAGRRQAESLGVQMTAVPSTDAGIQEAALDGRLLEVRAATAEEMTTLIQRGQRLPNLLAPLSKLCASVLYGADYLHTAVATDFQSRYGVK